MGPFATATELGEHAGLPIPDDLARWQSVLQSASDLMRSERGQVLSLVENESVVFSPTSEVFLWLWDTPVIAVDSVTENGVLLTTAQWENTTYGAIWHTDSAGRPTGVGWPFGATVVYDHGYRETDPDFGGLRTLCMRIAARALFPPDLSQGFVPVESASFAPQVFLTDQDRMELMGFGAAAVG